MFSSKVNISQILKFQSKTERKTQTKTFKLITLTVFYFRDFARDI